jgi:hypothetical protein
VRTQLTAREQVLAIMVGAVIFIFLNFIIIDYFLKNRARLSAELAQNSGALEAMKRQLSEKPVWEQRDAWLQESQPKLGAEDSAGVQLLDAVKELAKKNSVEIVTPSLRLPSYLPEYVSISVDLETTSTWASLIAFLHELQGPEKFVVLESTNLKIDEKDATHMRSHLRIAKWFAPKLKPK